MTSEQESVHRARVAADAVRRRFGRRLLGVPGTHLPRVRAPTGPGRGGPWHYWWLAHYLDCLLDEAERELRFGGDPRRAETCAVLAGRLLRTLRWRNGGRFSNDYYDDMGWLLLAASRWAGFGQRHPGLAAASAHSATACRQLAPALEAGISPGAGVYWNRRHDFLALAATGPAALHLARSGDRARAAALVDWVYATLHDARTGLLHDGVRRGRGGRWVLVPDVYTYNQGTVLGALVELGDPVSAARAGALVDAVAGHLTAAGTASVLVAHGGHDGGLFTGIAARYLALAARSPALAPPARRQAAALVHATGDALWAGRTKHQGHRPGPVRAARPSVGHDVPVFSPHPARPAAATAPPGAPVELSTQLQAWLVFEAADTLDDAPVQASAQPKDR